MEYLLVMVAVLLAVLFAASAGGPVQSAVGTVLSDASGVIQTMVNQALLEHAIVLTTLLAAVFAMSAYAKRGLQARYRTLVDGAVKAIRAPTQYEPYYASASSTATQDSTTTATYAPGGTVTVNGSVSRTSDPGGQERVGVELQADDAWQ